MEDISQTTYHLIASSYETYHEQVRRYIRSRINEADDADDLAQDVFLRLMECGQMLREETAKDFIFTIARNLVIDYLRRYYKRQEITSYIYDMQETATNEPESRVITRDLQVHEWMKVIALPEQRRKVYCMSRYEDRSTAEIAAMLNLSLRTVENHLFRGRKEVREYMRQCI